MQSGESSGRNASNNHPNAIGHHNSYAKSRARAGHNSMPNHRPTQITSGYNNNSEEKERQKQEARAQREMTGRIIDPEPERNEAMFALVPNCSESNRISDILGDFYKLVNCKNSNKYIGIDGQPATPAPTDYSHDPPLSPSPKVKNHHPPPPPQQQQQQQQPTPPSRSGGPDGSFSHQPHNSSSMNGSGGAPCSSRPKGTHQHRPPPFSLHHPKSSSEETKRIHKPGPGPGSGSINRSHPTDRISSSNRNHHQPSSNNNNNINASSLSNPPQQQKTKAPHPEELKVHQILNEVKSFIIDPSPNDMGFIETPRPDHHLSSSFTFPHLPPSSLPTNEHEFRVPLDPDVKGRLSSDRAKPIKNSAVETINGCELSLSDDCEDEVSSPSNCKLNESVQKNHTKRQTTGTSHCNQNKQIVRNSKSKLPSKGGSSNVNTFEHLKRKTTTESLTILESTCNSDTKGDDSIFNLSDDLALSTDGESEAVETKQTTANVSHSRLNPANNPNETYVKPMPPSASSFGEGVQRPMSPMARSSDETSNSDDSSETETEESSSSDDCKKSPLQPPDNVRWGLGHLFKINNSESPKHEISLKKDSMDGDNKPQSPRHPNDVAPPTAAAQMKHKKPKADDRPKKNIITSLSSDDTSDEDHPQQQQPQQQTRRNGRAPKGPGSRYGSVYKLPKIKHIEPILSSDSEDEGIASSHYLPPPTRKPTAKASTAKQLSQSLSKSPRNGASNNKHKKKPEGKRKEPEKIMKSKEYLPSDIDSDSDLVPTSSSKSKNKSTPSTNDQSSVGTRYSPKQKIAADTRKDSLIKSRTTNSEMRLKVSMPVSQEQIENLKPSKIEKSEKKRKSRSSESKMDKESRNDKENRIEKEMKYGNVPDNPVHSRLEPPPLSLVRDSPLHKNSLAGHVQYENGVPKLVCSIPFTLIDYIPSVKSKDKVNKEVLEMRTSGGNAKKKSPPNEDFKKLAIKTIYKYNKRPSSLEPDKTKRDNKSDDSCKPKSEDNQPIKTDTKLEDTKCKLEVPIKMESNLNRHGSNSSLSSTTTQESLSNYKPKRHKKDKRKDRSSSREKTKELNYESDKANERKKNHITPEADSVTKKRSREARHEESRSDEISSHHSKKVKNSPAFGIPSPSCNEERPPSSMSGEHYPSRRSKKSSHNKQPAGDEAVAGTSGDTSEYHSLPSSEHESRNGGATNYRPGPSPIPPSTEGASDMYPPPNAHSDFGGSFANSHQPYDSTGLLSSRQSSSLRLSSWGERKAPDLRKDHNTYLKNAIDLKHKADTEYNRTLQTVMYLEAVLYFILTGQAMETDADAYKMFNDTLLLIRHVSSLFRREITELLNTREITEGLNTINVILVVLSLRCQSLLSLKSYTMRRNEFKESYKFFTEYTKQYEKTAGQSCTPSSGGTMAVATAGGGGGTPSLPNVWSQRSGGANNSPSSLSPTPSPAGSVGSEGSQSSGYSTEGNRQQRGTSQAAPSTGLTTPPHPTVGVPVDIHASVIKYYNISHSLSQAFEMWNEADEFARQSDHIKEFFVTVNMHMGPLTFHSSLRELVPYVQEALVFLKRLTSQIQPEVVCSSTKAAPSGVK